LPLERRFSVGGAGTLPGFDFRRSVGAEDVGTCAAGAAPEGTPAQCERMALAQVEYRGDLRVRVFSDIDDEGGRRPRWRRFGYRTDATWVAFADAGRGWLVGPRVGTLQYPSGSFPTVDTFRSDVGLGLDLGGVSLDLGTFGLVGLRLVDGVDALVDVGLLDGHLLGRRFDGLGSRVRDSGLLGSR
jgi:hypothetical protein